jgi:hypothetical protein
LISFGCSASAPSFAWVPRQLDLVESFQFASLEICDPIEQWSFNSSRFFSILLSSQKLASIWSCNQSRGPWVSTYSHMPKRPLVCWMCTTDCLTLNTMWSYTIIAAMESICNKSEIRWI